MKLDKCLELAYTCGLNTVGEAYENVSIHAMNLFVYEDIPSEIAELSKDIHIRNVKHTDLVIDLISEKKQKGFDIELANSFFGYEIVSKKEIDKEMDEFFDKQESLPEIDVDCLFADGGIIAITPTHLFGE